MDNVKLRGQWVGDARGNKNYHAQLISMSAQFALDASTHCRLILHLQTAGGERRDAVLDEITMEGDFKEVRPQFEAWAQDRLERIASALTREFGRSLHEQRK